jgi:ribonuclease PH
LNITLSLPLFNGTHHRRNPPGPATPLEQFLAVRLEKLIGPMLLGHLFPKSGIDVNIGIIEYTGKWSLLALTTNAVSTAIAEAGIDVVDLVSASSFAVTSDGLVIDPTSEEEELASAGGVIGYMASTGEITDTWITGSLEVEDENGMDVDSGHVRLGEMLKTVVAAAADARLVINHALLETVKKKGLTVKET